MESKFETTVVEQPAIVTAETIAHDVATYKETGEGDFSKFFGGWEMPASKLDNLIAVSVIPSIPLYDDEGEPTGETIRHKWNDKFLTKVSTDGTTAVIFFGDPYNGKQCISKSTAMFVKMYDHFGTEGFYTKSVLKDLLADKYGEENNDI